MRFASISFFLGVFFGAAIVGWDWSRGVTSKDAFMVSGDFYQCRKLTPNFK